MSDASRPVRPTLNGSWTTPPANGRHSFKLRGFALGLIIGIAIVIPATTLLLTIEPTMASTGPRPAPAAAGLDAAVTAPPPVSAVVLASVDEPMTPETAVAPSGTVMRMRVTAYCPCRRCCGKFSDGKTASGKTIWTNNGLFVAAPKWLPFGATVRVPGYADGAAVPVLDRGKAIVGDRLDIFFFSHEEARRWGSQDLDVEVIYPGAE